MPILLSSCLWCREIIAQAVPGGPWRTGHDAGHCSVLDLDHEPLLITHFACDVIHATEADARDCARKG